LNCLCLALFLLCWSDPVLRRWRNGGFRWWRRCTKNHRAQVC